jgi:hypothetical protein
MLTCPAQQGLLRDQQRFHRSQPLSLSPSNPAPVQRHPAVINMAIFWRRSNGFGGARFGRSSLLLSSGLVAATSEMAHHKETPSTSYVLILLFEMELQEQRKVSNVRSDFHQGQGMPSMKASLHRDSGLFTNLRECSRSQGHP